MIEYHNINFVKYLTIGIGPYLIRSNHGDPFTPSPGPSVLDLRWCKHTRIDPLLFAIPIPCLLHNSNTVRLIVVLSSRAKRNQALEAELDRFQARPDWEDPGSEVSNSGLGPNPCPVRKDN